MLLLYILISGTYQMAAAVSLVVGIFDLRHQVQTPFEVGYEQPTITSVEKAGQKAGLGAGDTIESLNGEPYWGRALFQKVRWYAKPGDTMRFGVRHADGQRASVALPLIGYPSLPTVYESIFAIFLHVIVPLFCLALGYWVALARPRDLNAWLTRAIYEEESLTLNSGDLLVLYTDGFSEAMTHDDEEWGEERMLATVEAVRSKAAGEVISGLFEAADRFTQGAPQQDDMTLLALKINAA